MNYFSSTKNILPKKAVDQFAHLLDIFIEKKKPTETTLPNLQYGVEYDHVKKQLGGIIEKLIGRHDSPVCFLQRSVRPHYVHSDYPNNDNNKEPYCAVLFPLRFNGPCSTVVFKEKSKKKNIEHRDPKTNYQYTDEELKMLSHIDKNTLGRLSDPRTIKWNVGDAIVWERIHLHCSDNFLVNDTTFKDSLVLFTTRKQ